MAGLARQTFRDFEIVIVDDGSTDIETLRKLSELKGRARVVRQNNGGLSAARNSGFRAAHADWCCRSIVTTRSSRRSWPRLSH